MRDSHSHFLSVNRCVNRTLTFRSGACGGLTLSSYHIFTWFRCMRRPGVCLHGSRCPHLAVVCTLSVGFFYVQTRVRLCVRLCVRLFFCGAAPAGCHCHRHILSHRSDACEEMCPHGTWCLHWAACYAVGFLLGRLVSNCALLRSGACGGLPITLYTHHRGN